MQKVDLSGTSYDLPERYKPIKIVGKGTYGTVISATDT